MSNSKYINPYLNKMLEVIRLDKVFVKGEGNYLYDESGIQYLDFISSFGALPFGFNYPEIWDVLERIKKESIPTIVQASVSKYQEKVSERLIELAPEGFKYVVFANSGTEAVEIATKIVSLLTGKERMIVAKGGYHGIQNERFTYIPYGDITALEEELEENAKHYGDLMVEPIQGEGGIILPPDDYLSKVRLLCHKHNILFILDEIQTGLGRTGSLFLCEGKDFIPDILLIGKVLGGGIYPIGVCLIREEFYPEGFDLNNFSTFAGNNIACLIADKVLEILIRDDRSLIKRIRENGERLIGELLRLKDKFPTLIKDIRGKGYLLGIELDMDRKNYPQSILSVLSEQENLVPIVVSYLLNEKKIRLAPTLKNNKVIRLEPSFITTWDECQKVVESLEDVFNILDEMNTPEIIRPILNISKGDFSLYNIDVIEKEPREDVSPSLEDGRFAFLVHPIDLANYSEFDPTLIMLPRDKIAVFSEIGKDLIKPFVIGKVRINSDYGATAYGEFINIPYTARQMIETPQDKVIKVIESAVSLAVDRGAKILGLGAYTSVITRGGTLLKGKYVPLTTGNSYTVVASIDALKLASAKLEIDLSQSTVSVVGATGSIGRALAILLSEDIHKIILVGNPSHPKSSVRRLRKVGIDLCLNIARRLESGWRPSNKTIGEYLSTLILPSYDDTDSWEKILSLLEKEGYITITTNLLSAVSSSDIIVTATNSPRELIEPSYIKFGAIICDISRPPNVSPLIKELRPDVLVIDGGVVEIPGKPSLGWYFGFERGLAYACMAETMMLALEKNYTDMSLGSDLTIEGINYFRELAKKHGFKVSQLRSFDRPISEEEWNKLVTARQKDLP
ncbi:MAG: aminotransferase class III-fold pyridoxal phosphate-dependent enzyme [bacterium]|nr:aminotransferase class III-fold pyridoxal phosphate-dependent enzyme [bacterium]